ncbi:MAG: PEP-utilizing enzyme [Dehalococcoidia bacterium]
MGQVATDAAQAFPIHWEDPAYEQASWFQDVMHNPLPITPLNATLFQPAFAEGASRAFARLSLPIDGLRISVQNGYAYIGPSPVMGEPAELEARFAEGQHITMELGATVLKDWRETFEPQVLERCRRILAFDYEGASAAGIARLVSEIRTDLVDVWDIHMRVNIPPMGGVFGLEELVAGALGEEAVAQSRLLLQGFDNKSIELGHALWDLSRWVRSDDKLKAAVLAARVRAGVVELGDTAQPDEFQKRLRAFLDAYGWRSDRFFEIGHPSWHEDPSTPLTQLKRYTSMEDAKDPFASHTQQAEDRDRLAAEMEAKLPEELRPAFRGILPVAQQYVPIAEDHNFTIDQKFTAVVRHAVLHLGRKLVAAGALGDAEDVFFLTYDEIQGLASGTDGKGLDAAVRERRREYARQATLNAPPMIGTPPPEDAPPDLIVTKFLGIGLTPSDNPGIVTGHPCSTGVVTGEAKVVRTLDEADKINPGDVLVCRMTMPAWTPLFGVVAAVVADSGGPLSHCAIVAREYRIPCVAGTQNGTTVIKDGMRVRVDGGTGIVTILEERRRG